MLDTQSNVHVSVRSDQARDPLGLYANVCILGSLIGVSGPFLKLGDANEERRVGMTCLGLTQYSVTLQHNSITYISEWTR